MASTEEWNKDWREFINDLGSRLKNGETINEISDRLIGSRVTWSGVLAKKDLHHMRGSPSVLILLEPLQLMDIESHYVADKVRLRFSNDPSKVSPWNQVPLEAQVTFQAIIGDPIWQQSVELINGQLVIHTAKDALLLSPREHALPSTKAIESTALRSNVANIVSCRDKPAHRTDIEAAAVSWTHTVTTIGPLETANPVNGKSFAAGLITFWGRVFEAFDQSAMAVIHIVGAPAHFNLTVDFRSPDLTSIHARRLQYCAPKLADALIRHPASDQNDIAEASRVFADFWSLVHLTMAIVTDHLPRNKGVYSDLVVVGCEPGELTYVQMRL